MLKEQELAIVVGIDIPGTHAFSIAESLEELKRLADTAGAVVVGQITQKRERPNQRYYIGSGKLEELKQLIAELKANLIIFDVEIFASQQRNLELELGIKVIDRTELILDIFAQHANTREGTLQVELAQANFLMTRLVGQGDSLSRLGGGIGTRGPGETKLEYDRRKTRKKISDLKKEIEKLSQERAIRREKRKKSHLPLVSLVGYTNAGKSTLLNALTKADVFTQDKLFATLDPTVRRFYLPSNKTILISDTVGFIQKLPHQLVAAFHATLEEVSFADLLIHVVDCSHQYFNDQIKAVEEVLDELKAADKPIITVYNKIDKATVKLARHSLAISATKKEGLDELVKLLDQQLGQQL